MDVVIQTSLEALLLKATNPQNQNIDTAAVEAFCTLVNKEKDGVFYGVKVLASRLPTGNEKEMLQTLHVLDICMSRCGSQFQSEVGKFRFLNEMIKLVSPKYSGSHTPIVVKQKVLQLMYIWTLDYPKETKIKEAYEMLRKQGVIKGIPNPNINTTTQYNIPKPKSPNNTLFQDEEKSKILQKLLQSKDPEDIQAANWLIKSMVKEDDKRAELKSKYISELESAQNNVRLLNEMLDSYKLGMSSSDEVELIKELHQSCERLRPNVMRLATETTQGEEILREALQVNDEMAQVFTKFNNLFDKMASKDEVNSLLTFDLTNITKGTTTTTTANISINNDSTNKEQKSDIDVLSDIFASSVVTDSSEILQPTLLLPNDVSSNEILSTNIKTSGLEDLDVLSEHLFKENLLPTKQSNFKKNHEKIPMNLLAASKLPSTTTTINSSNTSNNTATVIDSKNKLSSNDSIDLDLDLNCLINKTKEELNFASSNTNNNSSNNGDKLIDIGDEKMLDGNDDNSLPEETSGDTYMKDNKKEIIEMQQTPSKLSKLNDIFIDLKEIKPSNRSPITLLDEKDGINITIHFVRDKPKEDIYVFVVTTISRKDMPINNYLFQAVVPKECKLKLQAPSATDLPSHNPFLPPAAITQIMLIACPSNVKVFLKFVISYTMADETYTEMGEIEDLPLA